MDYHHTILHVLFYTGLYGAEQSLLTIIDRLSSRGFRSIVAVFRPGPLTEQLSALGVPVIFVPTLKPWLPMSHVSAWKRILFNFYQMPFLFSSVWKLFNVIKQYQVDLVHTGSAVVLDGAVAAKLAGIPHVWHIRETVESGQTLTFFLGTSMARHIIKWFSDRVVANSQAIAKSYLHSPADCQKVRVIHNGINLTPYNQTNVLVDLRHSLGVPEKAPLVGMVAQLMPLKRHIDFLQAAALVRDVCPDAYFLCAGGDPTQPTPLMRSLQQFSQQAGLTNHLLWLPHQAQVYQLFMALDLVVLPSVEESFGRVLVEAMAARKPVVATQVGGILDIVVHSETGLLVPPLQPERLAAAILQLLQNPIQAQAMGQRGRQRVEQLFTDQHFGDGIENIYWELLS